MDKSKVILDFIKRYRNTWVWVEGHGFDSYFLISSVTDTGKITIINSEDKFQIKYGSSFGKIRVKHPSCGYFMHENIPYFISKRMSKQYSKGICRDNYWCIDLLANKEIDSVDEKLLLSALKKSPGRGEGFEVVNKDIFIKKNDTYYRDVLVLDQKYIEAIK